MELQLGGIQVLPTTNAETNANKMRPRFSLACGFSRVFTFTLTPQKAYIRIWRIMAILIGGKPEYPPIWAPWRDKDGAGSGIFRLYLVVQSEVTSTWSKITVLMYLFCLHRMRCVFVCARFVSTYSSSEVHSKNWPTLGQYWACKSDFSCVCRNKSRTDNRLIVISLLTAPSHELIKWNNVISYSAEVLGPSVGATSCAVLETAGMVRAIFGWVLSPMRNSRLIQMLFVEAVATIMSHTVQVLPPRVAVCTCWCLGVV